MDACEADVIWDGDAEETCEEETCEEETCEEEIWEEETCEDAATEAWDADEDWIEADAAWDEEAAWLKTELLFTADDELADALLTGALLPRMRTELVDDAVVTAAWDEEDCEPELTAAAWDEEDCRPELTAALPADPAALGLVFEDAGTFADELLDAACDATTDRLAVELVGFTPATPPAPLVRVTTGFVLVDDDEDWTLADEEEDWTLADDEVDWLLANDEATDAGPVATLDDETTEEDLAAGAPLVLVTTGATDAELEAAELDCAAATLDETFEEELATEDELFRAEAEAWPRVAVTEGLVLELELLTLEDDCLLEAVETFEEDLEADFAEVVVALTDDALVLDVAVLKIHVHALDTWDADRPGIGELVLVSAAHHLQKGVV
jgi:hypothetical protein